MNLKMYGFLIIFTNLDFLNEGGFEILAIFSKNQIQHKNVKEGMVLSLFLFNKVSNILKHHLVLRVCIDPFH